MEKRVSEKRWREVKKRRRRKKKEKASGGVWGVWSPF